MENIIEIIKEKRKPVKAKGRGYAGLEKQKVYLYSNNGKYLREYESRREFLNDYFPNYLGNRPLFISDRKNDRGGFGYELLVDGNFICNFKAGREYLRKHEHIVNSIHCNNPLTKRKIECFNLAGEKIAEFLNARVAENLTKVHKSTIWSSCNAGKGYITKTELIFKYKKEDEQP